MPPLDLVVVRLGVSPVDLQPELERFSMELIDAFRPLLGWRRIVKPGSIFFITGAANGIGARAAERAVGDGHRVVVADVDESAASDLCKRLGDRAFAVRLDVRDVAGWEEALDAAWAQFGGIDILVNNAGLIHPGWFREQSIEQVEHMVQVNLLGLIKGVRAILPRFAAQGHGHIINIASYVAFAVLKGQTVYSATKHAVRAFHHGVAQEHENDPIDFTLICPTAVDTRMLRQQIGQDSCALAFSEASVTPEQVADAIHRAAEEKPLEILVPRWPGAALRFIGVMPRLLRSITRRAEQKGLKVVARQRQRGGE